MAQGEMQLTNWKVAKSENKNIAESEKF